MSVQALTVLAEGPTGRYSGISPLVNAICVMAGFIVLLFLTTRLNRDK
jgi:hypothetical protein